MLAEERCGKCHCIVARAVFAHGRDGFTVLPALENHGRGSHHSPPPRCGASCLRCGLLGLPAACRTPPHIHLIATLLRILLIHDQSPASQWFIIAALAVALTLNLALVFASWPVLTLVVAFACASFAVIAPGCDAVLS